MKPIAADASRRVFPWNCECLRERRLAPMEGRIKADDLGDMGRGSKNGPDRCKIMRLMKWSERYKLGKLVENPGVDAFGRAILRSPMNDPMADSFDPATRYQASRCFQDDSRCGIVIKPIGRPFAVLYHGAIRIRDL